MSDDVKNTENELSAELQEALKKLNLNDTDWARALSPEEILYLLSQCPFLQIVSTGEVQALEEPEFITAKSGWKIHYYGNAMSSSPGELLFKSSDFRQDDGGESGKSGRGTIVKQAFDTAADMIAFAQKRGWRGVHIVDGHPLMVWAAWMQAQDDAYSITGYTPDEKEIKKRERLKRSEIEDLLRVGRKPIF